MIDELHKKNFNTIYFQVRPRGNTFYPSAIEPWASQLSGVLGRDPGWDPLQYAIDEAHKRGMELHAWFNVAKVWGLDNPPVHPQHLFRTHRNWLKQVDGEWWIDMGIPQARKYTEDLVMEIAENYDVDGIHFDFIRYPADSFDDGKSFRTWSDGAEKDQWRRDNITSFVKECYNRIRRIAPRMKIGSAPIGIYRPMNGANSSFTGYAGVYQDARGWLRDGIHDYLVPQLYWSIGEQNEPYDPDFSSLCFDWAGERYGRHVYAGIGIYRDNVQPETQRQIAVARENGMQGEAFFRFEHLSSVAPQIAALYRSPSLVPPMRWKDSIPPLPPQQISVAEDAGKIPLIRWQSPPSAADGEKAFRYVIYRSTTAPVDIHNPENILGIVPASDTVFRDDDAAHSGKKYTYTVTSLDRTWNESSPDNLTAEKTIRIPHLSETSVIVSQNYPEPFDSVTFLALSLPRTDQVVITLRQYNSMKETTIVNAKKNPGTHIFGMKSSGFTVGPIECSIRFGTDIIRKTITKK